MIRTEAELARSQDAIAQAQNAMIEAQDKVVSLQKDLAAQAQEIQQAQQAYQAAKSEAERLSSERRSEILARLQQRREELTTLEGQLAQAKQQLEQETMIAPTAGTVYNVKASLGPVQAGEELLSILPQGESVRLEAKVRNQDIGFIAQGMPVKVKVATFPFQEFGTINGEVDEISADAIQDRELGLVFPVTVKLKQHSIQVRREAVTLAPGMAATGEIVTRQKSILAFLLDPVVRKVSEAFSVR